MLRRALEADPENIDLALREIRVKFIETDGEDAIILIKEKLDALLQKIRKRYNLPEATREQRNPDVAEFYYCGDLAECEQTVFDNRQLVEILVFISSFYQFQGDFKTARGILDQCMEMEHRLGFDHNSLQILTIQLSLLQLVMASGGQQVKEEQSQAIIFQLTSLIESEGVSVKGFVWLNKLSEFLLYQGKDDEAYRCLQRTLTMGRTLFGVNPNFNVAYTLVMLGKVSIGLSLLEEGKFYLEQFLQLMPSPNGKAWLIIFKEVYRLLAVICANTNQHEEAISNLQKGLAVKARATNWDFCLDCFMYCAMAKSWYVLDAHEKAWQSVIDAEECLKNIVDVTTRARLTCSVAETYLEVGKNEEAIKLMKQELDSLDSQSDSVVEVQYLNSLGQICMKQGFSEDAEHYCKKALEILGTRKEYILYIVECLLNISNILLENDKSSEAISYVDDARKYISTMKANHEKCTFLKKIADCWEKLGEVYQARNCLEEALDICKDSVVTSKVPLTELGLHVKLGDLAENVNTAKSSHGEVSVSTEQIRKAKGFHYDQAAKVLRRHSASGNFNSTTLFLFTYLASKYHSIDLLQQEKLLLEALKMSEEIYTPGHVCENVASILISLSDVCSQKEDYESAFNYLDRSLKMEMEIHSSDPYHSHIWYQISNLFSLYLVYPCSKQLLDAILSTVKFLECEEKVEGSINHANKANIFVGMAFLFVCLGDFEKAEKLNQAASDIFATINGNDVPKGTLLNTEICHLMRKFLELLKATSDCGPLFKKILSSGLLASFFQCKTSEAASASSNKAICIGKFFENKMTTTVAKGQSSDPSNRDIKTLTCDVDTPVSDGKTSRCSKSATGDSSVYEVSTCSIESSKDLAEDEISSQAKTGPTNEVSNVTSSRATGLPDLSPKSNMSSNLSRHLTKSAKIPQEKSERTTVSNAVPDKSITSASTWNSKLDSNTTSNSPAQRQEETIGKNDELNEVRSSHEKKNDKDSSPGIKPPGFDTMRDFNKDVMRYTDGKKARAPEIAALDESAKKLDKNEIFKSEMDSLTSVADSVKYDLSQGNVQEAGKCLEDHLFPLVMSAFDNVALDLGQFLLNEALIAREKNDISLMLAKLHLAAKYQSNPKRKAEISKLSGQGYLHVHQYRMAAISFTEAVASSKASEPFDEAEYTENLIGLTKSHMYCNNLHDALCACQEGIALTSSMEPGLSKNRLLVQLLYLAAKCTIKLSTQLPTELQDLRKAVSFCQLALSTSKEEDDRMGSSNLIEEVGGPERGQFFAMKCEIRLMLASSFIRLKKLDEAVKIVREMKEFLENIAVVFETFSQNTWPGGEINFLNIRRRLFSWIGQTLVMSGESNLAADPLRKSLAAFLIGFFMDIVPPQEEVFELLDAITATKAAVASKECCPFRQTLDLCKQLLLEQDIPFIKLQNFFGSLGNLFVDCGRTNDAIVVYEAGLGVAECMENTNEKNSRQQFLLYIAGAYRLQSMKSTGKVAADERRLAESYYLTAQMIKDGSFATDLIYAYFLFEQGRLENAIHVLEQMTEEGERLWDEQIIISYHKSRLFGPGVQKYIESNGQLLAPIGNLAYSLLVRAYVAMGMKKKAVRAFEKFSTNGKDVRPLFDSRPPSLPYLLSVCQKSLQSLIGDGFPLQLDDSEYPLSVENLARMYYELSEFELTLEYCNKAMMTTGSISSKESEQLDWVQRQLLLLRLAGNAVLMLERKNESYHYFNTFLKLLQYQTSILDLQFEEQHAILGQFFFANRYYVYRSLGMLLVGRGNIDGAISCYEYCLDLDRGYNCDQNLVGTLAELYQTKAFTTGKDDKVTHLRWMKKAQQCFDELIRRNTELTPFVEETFASFLFRTEQLQKAVFHFEHVLGGTENTLISFANEDKPLLSEYLQHEIEARSPLQLPLKIYVYNQAALTYWRLGKEDNVRETVVRMEEHVSHFRSSPHFPLILSALGYTYQQIGNKRKAAEIYTAVLEITPSHPPVKLALESCTTCE